MPHPIPYRAALSTPLITFSHGDKITTRNAVEGTAIFGGTGSGKTSGSLRAYCLAFLRAGFGGLVMCAKPDEADRWRDLARQVGRERDLVFFREDQHRFNFLDYAVAMAPDDSRDLAATEILTLISEVARNLGGQSGTDSENAFFRDSARQMVANAIPIVRVAHGTLRLRDLYEFINSAPLSREKANERGASSWAATSFCGKTIARIAQMAIQNDKEAMRIDQQHLPYFLEEFPALADRTRSSILTTFTSTIYEFLAGSLNEMFCTNTTIVPEYTRQGIIIVMDLPRATHGIAGLMSQHIMKVMFQRSMEREKVNKKTRPVFMVADECQFFINSWDAEHLGVCRSARVANIFVTQDLPTYYARMPSDDAADSLIGKFGTTIFHASTDRRTTESASNRIGMVRKTFISETREFGTAQGDSGGGEYDQPATLSKSVSRSKSRQTELVHDIEPNYFGNHLRNGGKDNNFRVDAIVLRSGGKFKSTRKNRIKATFAQK